MGTIIRPAQPSDIEELATMRALLWPDSPIAEHRRELERYFSGLPTTTLPLINLVAEWDAASSRPNPPSPDAPNVPSTPVLAGFLEVDLRSHADGCDPLQPVGYLEGWFVHEAFRRHGIGALLVRAAEDWARSHGCREIASDTWIGERSSEHAHLALGYEIVDRCIHFRKAI